MRALTLLFVSILVLMVVASTGCGPESPPAGNVQGQITYKSQPVTSGMVVFENPSLAWIVADDLDAEGRYELPEVRVAEYHVSIQPPQPQVPNESTHSIEEIQAYSRNPKKPDPKNIPRSVRNTQSTPLRANVADGDNTFDFDLAHATGKSGGTP